MMSVADSPSSHQIAWSKTVHDPYLRPFFSKCDLKILKVDMDTAVNILLYWKSWNSSVNFQN